MYNYFYIIDQSKLRFFVDVYKLQLLFYCYWCNKQFGCVKHIPSIKYVVKDVYLWILWTTCWDSNCLKQWYCYDYVFISWQTVWDSLNCENCTLRLGKYILLRLYLVLIVPSIVQRQQSAIRSSDIKPRLFQSLSLHEL